MCHGANHHLLSHYVKTGQREEADKQRKANENLNKMRKLKIATERNRAGHTPILNNFFSLSNPTQVVIKIVSIAIIVFASLVVLQFD